MEVLFIVSHDGIMITCGGKLSARVKEAMLYVDSAMISGVSVTTDDAPNFFLNFIVSHVILDVKFNGHNLRIKTDFDLERAIYIVTQVHNIHLTCLTIILSQNFWLLNTPNIFAEAVWKHKLFFNFLSFSLKL